MYYKIPIFLSYPQPFKKNQNDFIEKMRELLDSRGLNGRTLGVTDYDMQEPLTAIRRVMLECNGIITIAFRRHHIETGKSKPNSDIGNHDKDKDKNKDKNNISGRWFTSPYCQIEPAMAFQLGLPVLVLREKGVIDEGLLEKGVIGTYLPEFCIDVSFDEYIKTHEFKQIFGQWEGYVRQVVENKGKPPKLY